MCVLQNSPFLGLQGSYASYTGLLKRKKGNQKTLETLELKENILFAPEILSKKFIRRLDVIIVLLQVKACYYAL